MIGPIVQVWDVAAAACTRVFQGHTGGVTGVTLCGPRLVSASIDKSLIVWEMEAAAPAKRLLGHTASVNCVASVRDDRVVSGGDDKLLLVRAHTQPRQASAAVCNTLGCPVATRAGVGRTVRDSDCEAAGPHRLRDVRGCRWVAHRVRVDGQEGQGACVCVQSSSALLPCV